VAEQVPAACTGAADTSRPIVASKPPSLGAAVQRDGIVMTFLLLGILGRAQ
jgi:hypothetical protein